MGKSKQSKNRHQQLHHTESNTFYQDKFNMTDMENDTSNNEMRYSKVSENFNEEDYDRPVPDIVPVYEAEPEEE